MSATSCNEMRKNSEHAFQLHNDEWSYLDLVCHKIVQGARWLTRLPCWGCWIQWDHLQAREKERGGPSLAHKDPEHHKGAAIELCNESERCCKNNTNIYLAALSVLLSRWTSSAWVLQDTQHCTPLHIETYYKSMMKVKGNFPDFPHKHGRGGASLCSRF